MFFFVLLLRADDVFKDRMYANTHGTSRKYTEQQQLGHFALDSMGHFLPVSHHVTVLFGGVSSSSLCVILGTCLAFHLY